MTQERCVVLSEILQLENYYRGRRTVNGFTSLSEHPIQSAYKNVIIYVAWWLKIQSLYNPFITTKSFKIRQCDHAVGNSMRFLSFPGSIRF